MTRPYIVKVSTSASSWGLSFFVEASSARIASNYGIQSYFIQNKTWKAKAEKDGLFVQVRRATPDEVERQKAAQPRPEEIEGAT